MNETGQSIQDYIIQKYKELREVKDKEDKDQEVGDEAKPQEIKVPASQIGDESKQESKDAASDAEAQKKKEEEEQKLKEQ